MYLEVHKDLENHEDTPRMSHWFWEILLDETKLFNKSEL